MGQMKICTQCKTSKLLIEYGAHPLGVFKKQSMCRQCRRENWRGWREKNKPMQAARASKQRKINQEKFHQFKSTLKCERCGFAHPAALVFHHRDPK